MKSPVLLRIYFNEKLEGVRQFTDAQIVIGRNTEAQVNLPEEDVSPLHAVIEERESGYYISDLGSQTGTYRNGQKILDDQLNSGDEIKVGSYKIQFFVGVPKPVAPPAKTDNLDERTATSVSVPPPVAPVTPVAPPPVAPAAAKPVETPAPKIPQAPPTPPATPPAAPTLTPPPEDVQFAPATTVPPIIPQVKPAETRPVEQKPAPAQKTYPVGPAVGASVVAAGSKKSGKSEKKTFAPPSAVRDPKEILKPGKGTAVEVSVAWRERIIATHHFNEKRSVTIGSSEAATVFIPLLTSKTNYELFQIAGGVTIYLSPEMTGEFINEQGQSYTFSELLKMNRLRNRSGGYELTLGQGEMVRIGLQGDLISIYIRYVPQAPKPLVAPLLDLTASEVTGVVLAAFIAGIFGLYMMVYAPTNLPNEELLEEQLRKATVTFTPPPPKKRVEVKEEQPPVRVEVKDTPKPVKKPEQVRTTPKPTVEKAGKPGAAAEVAPKPTKDKEVKLTSTVKQGGAIKTGDKDGANMKSAKPDPTKQGLLSVFGSQGAQQKLAQAYSGAGELVGTANEKTGAAGFSEDRPGEGLGGKLKDTGAGGKGTATVGIAGVGTQGKGTGYSGTGTGGIGTKGSVEIDVGGQEAEITGTIDREAIRRVVQANYNSIKFCYDKALQRNRDLFGKLVLEWDIAEQGRVTRAVVKSNTLGNTEVANCIITRLKTWTFPEPPANQIAVVAFPFVFSAQ